MTREEFEQVAHLRSDSTHLSLCHDSIPSIRAYFVSYVDSVHDATCMHCLCEHLRRNAQELVRSTLAASAHRASLKATIRRIFELSAGEDEEIRFASPLLVRFADTHSALDDLQRDMEVASRRFHELITSAIDKLTYVIAETDVIQRRSHATSATLPETKDVELVLAIEPNLIGGVLRDVHGVLTEVLRSGRYAKIAIELREPRP